MLVKDILHLSPLRLITAHPDMSISDAAQRMAQYNVGIVVVMDDQDDFVGVLSERDIVRGLGTSDTPLDEVVVGDLMTESVVTVSPEASLVEAVQAMNCGPLRLMVNGLLPCRNGPQ